MTFEKPEALENTKESRDKIVIEALRLLNSGKYVVEEREPSGYTGMGSGISATRNLIIDESKGIVIGFGEPWASGEPTRPEEPVWFYGIREDLPEDVRPLESSFPPFEKINKSFDAVFPQALENERRFDWKGERTEQQIIDDASISAAFTVTGSNKLAERFLELRQSAKNQDTES